MYWQFLIESSSVYWSIIIKVDNTDLSKQSNYLRWMRQEIEKVSKLGRKILKILFLAKRLGLCLNIKVPLKLFGHPILVCFPSTGGRLTFMKCSISLSFISSTFLLLSLARFSFSSGSFFRLYSCVVHDISGFQVYWRRSS